MQPDIRSSGYELCDESETDPGPNLGKDGKRLVTDTCRYCSLPYINSTSSRKIYYR